MKLKELILNEMKDRDYSKTTLEQLMEVNLDNLSSSDKVRLANLFYNMGTAIEDYEISVYEELVQLYGGDVNDWDPIDYGLDSGVGADFWYKNKHTGQVVYVNEDQDYRTFSGE